MDPGPLDADLARAERLLPRYATAGPRYTSYPTAPVFSERFGPGDLRRALARAGRRGEEGLSLYVHVPFCRSLCHFCACNRVITRRSEPPARYLDAVERELALVREALGARRSVVQQHWGGGTPTHLAPAQIRRLFRAVCDAFPLGPGAEVSIEVDPRVTGDEHVEALRECGFGRLSMGVQDFDPRVQEAIRRVQPVAATGRLVERARRAGFESVGFDLIYGLPHQGPESFARTLAEVVALAPDRIALYSYAHVTWVAKQQRGFERGGISELRECYAQSQRELEPWERALRAGRLATLRGHWLSEDDRDRAFAIARLMCRGELDAADFARARGAELRSRLAPELARLAPLAEDGLVELAADGSVRVTGTGRLFLRNVAMVFDAYLPAQAGAGRPLFSQTV